MLGLDLLLIKPSILSCQADEPPQEALGRCQPDGDPPPARRRHIEDTAGAPALGASAMLSERLQWALGTAPASAFEQQRQGRFHRPESGAPGRRWSIGGPARCWGMTRFRQGCLCGAAPGNALLQEREGQGFALLRLAAERRAPAQMNATRKATYSAFDHQAGPPRRGHAGKQGAGQDIPTSGVSGNQLALVAAMQAGAGVGAAQPMRSGAPGR